MYYTFVLDRESQKWYRGIDPEWYNSEKYVMTGKRGQPIKPHFVKIREQRSWLLYNPEKISCFIEKHKIIEAESEEEAWQILNSTLGKPKSEMLSLLQ